MKATTSSFTSSYGTIVFGNADLQSDTFTAGSAGWRIRANGDSEFNNISARGALTGGAGGNLTIIDSRGLQVGSNAGGDRLAIEAPSAEHSLRSYNASNVVTTDIGTISVAGTKVGFVNVNDSAGNAKIILNGNQTAELFAAMLVSVPVSCRHVIDAMTESVCAKMPQNGPVFSPVPAT